MFKDKYNNSLNNISPDGYIKQKVLGKINNPETANKKLSKPMLTAIAVAASLLVALSGVTISLIVKNPFEDTDLIYSEHSVESEIIESESITSEDESVISSGSSETSVTNKPEKLEGYDFSKVPKEYLNIFNKVTNDGKIYYRYEYSDDEIIEESDSKSSSPSSDKHLNISNSDTVTTNSNSPSFSNTNIQVNGVDEADCVKTDGKYIYSIGLRYYKTGVYKIFLNIVEAGSSPQFISELNIDDYEDFHPQKEMFLCKEKLVIFGYSYTNNSTKVKILDISNPKKPKILHSIEQSGFYNTSRLIGDKLYLISNMYVSHYNIKEDSPETYVPTISARNHNGAVKAEDLLIQNNCLSYEYSVISGYNISKGTMVDNLSVFGGTNTVYCNTTNIIIAGYNEDGYTPLNCFKIGDGNIGAKAIGKIKGTLLNQFSIDEYGGYFRFVTTDTFGGKRANNLIVLDSKLNIVSSIENIAPDERVKSVKFMGDIAYFVTFRQVDPLFSVDLSNPKEPKIIGTLKIPGFSTYMFPYGENRLLGVGYDADENTGRTIGIKLSMFDISNPADVKEIAKYVIEGASSEVTNNHKAIFYDAKKNLIGISHRSTKSYYLFSFENNQFVKKGSYTCLKQNSDYARGLYINDVFYIAAERTLTAIDMNSFNCLNYIEYDNR